MVFVYCFYSPSIISGLSWPWIAQKNLTFDLTVNWSTDFFSGFSAKSSILRQQIPQSCCLLNADLTFDAFEFLS